MANPPMPAGPHAFVMGENGYCGQALTNGVGDTVICGYGQRSLLHEAHGFADPDEVVHYRIPGGASPLTLCGLDVWADDTSVTERAGSSNCPACRAAAGEDEPAAPSGLLDLVRQYGDQRGMLEVRRPHMAAASAERWDASIAALYDQIAVAAQRLSENDATGDLQAQRDEALSEVERLRRLLKDQASNFAAATTRAGADPLVLSLPQVPPGTVALVGAKTGTRYEQLTTGRDAGDWKAVSGQMAGATTEFAVVLKFEGSVSVVMREPRTWPKLSKGPADVRVILGASGQTWYRDEIRHDLWRANNGAIVHGDIPGLQALDGPLTEVLDA